MLLCYHKWGDCGSFCFVSVFSQMACTQCAHLQRLVVPVHDLCCYMLLRPPLYSSRWKGQEQTNSINMVACLCCVALCSTHPWWLWWQTGSKNKQQVNLKKFIKQIQTENLHQTRKLTFVLILEEIIFKSLRISR